MKLVTFKNIVFMATFYLIVNYSEYCRKFGQTIQEILCDTNAIIHIIDLE